jgi:hypothetical protein
VLAAVLPSIPYAIVLLSTPPGATYTGVLFAPENEYRYLTSMTHAYTDLGMWRAYFTYQQLPALPINLFYGALGFLVPPGAGPAVVAVVYQLARVVLSALLAWQAWRLYAEALAERLSRRLALVFLLFTAGLGLVPTLVPALSFGDAPFDLQLAEASAFGSMVREPHLVATLLLIVVVLRALLKVTSGSPGRRWAVAWGLTATAALSVIHPERVILLALAAAVLLGWTWWRDGRPPAAAAGRALMVLAGGAPYALLSLWLTRTDAQVQGALAQDSPGAIHALVPYFLFGVGIPGLLALVGLPSLLRAGRAANAGVVLLWGVVLATPVLVLAPQASGWHAGEGLPVAVAGLAGWALARDILPRLRGVRPRRLLTAALVVASTPSIMVLTLVPAAVARAGADAPYVSADDTACLAWLRDNARGDDVVFGGPDSEWFSVTYAHVRAVYGDPSYTPHSAEEVQAARDLLAGRRPATDYMVSRSVDWIYFGPRERQTGVGLDPARVAGAPVHRCGATALYRVGG